MLYKSDGSFFYRHYQNICESYLFFSRMTALIGIGVGELALAKVGDYRGQEVKSSPRMHGSQVSAGLG